MHDLPLELPMGELLLLEWHPSPIMMRQTVQSSSLFTGMDLQEPVGLEDRPASSKRLSFHSPMPVIMCSRSISEITGVPRSEDRSALGIEKIEMLSVRFDLYGLTWLQSTASIPYESASGQSPWVLPPPSSLSDATPNKPKE